MVDVVLLVAPPYPEADRLVWPLTKNPLLGVNDGPASYADYIDWRDSGIFEDVGIYFTDNVVLAVYGQSERVISVSATSGVLSALKVRPLAGRIFTVEESKPSLNPVALVAEPTWRRRFGADPKLLGSTIKINGLAQHGRRHPAGELCLRADPELWTSLRSTGDEAPRANRYWGVLARLRKGSTLQQTRLEFDRLSRCLAAAYPDSNRDWGADIDGLKDAMVGDARAQLLVLLGAVGFVWLIVCANIATLMLVRASGRSREMAVRAALGASGARLVRQLVTESLVLVLTGGSAGIAIAWTAVSALREYGPAGPAASGPSDSRGRHLRRLYAGHRHTHLGLLCSLGPVIPIAAAIVQARACRKAAEVPPTAAGAGSHAPRW